VHQTNPIASIVTHACGSAWPTKQAWHDL